MRMLLLSVSAVVITYLAAIIPSFIFGVEVDSDYKPNYSEAALEAKRKYDDYKKNPRSLEEGEFEGWIDELNKYKAPIATFQEIEEASQMQSIWVSWIPVFLLFYMFSSRYSDVFAYAGLSLLMYFAHVFYMPVAITSVLATALAVYIVKKTKRRESPDNSSK